MNALTPIPLPRGAALRQQAFGAMDIILHLGAHRTGTKTFQDYMHRHAKPLAAQGVCFWGPRPSGRNFWCAGDHPGRLARKVHHLLDRACDRGVKTLVVSDENILGTVAGNVRSGMFYGDAEDRVRAISQVFDGRISGVMLGMRELDTYWCSALACAVAGGAKVPDHDTRRALAASPRGWREVICDVANALPEVPLCVLPFESFAGRPDGLLARGAGIDAPFDEQRAWLGRVPTLPELRRVLTERGAPARSLPFGMGRWNPFTNEEHARLRERHADDMMWLTSGAGGIATLTEDDLRDRTGSTPSAGALDKGQSDELEKRRLARPRGG